jgi:hypothetical protein
VVVQQWGLWFETESPTVHHQRERKSEEMRFSLSPSTRLNLFEPKMQKNKNYQGGFSAGFTMSYYSIVA